MIENAYREATLLTVLRSRRWKRDAKKSIPVIAIGSVIVSAIVGWIVYRNPTLQTRDWFVTFALTAGVSAATYFSWQLVPRFVRLTDRTIIIDKPGVAAKFVNTDHTEDIHIRKINSTLYYIFTSDREFAVIVHATPTPP